MPEDSYIFLSALQHYLFCQRQCALIHVEQAWAENRYTAEGQVVHKRAHEGLSESRQGVRTVRTLSVASKSLQMTGQCDVIEFHSDGTVVPIEYKRGKPKSHRADEVQLCAQAICLEEMLNIKISSGFLFYDQTKRRTCVSFDDDLRALVVQTAVAIHSMVELGLTPAADYEKKKCQNCSLIEVCRPGINRSAARWLQLQLANPLL